MNRTGDGTCFHCGLPLPPNGGSSAVMGAEERLFCCAGCRSVCIAIHEAGLEGFYKRTPEGRRLGPPPDPPKGAEIYGLEDIQREFTTRSGEMREAQLLVEGIHCAACVWLIERAVNRADGAVAEVNLACRRLKLRWNEKKAPLAATIKMLARFGFSVVPYTRRRAEESAKRKRRTSLFRIGFSGFAAMNMMWCSIALWNGAAGGEYRDFFRYLELALAFPVVAYSGWPFLRGAYFALRSHTLNVDVPIVIGMGAVFLYSAYIALVTPSAGEVYFDTLVVFIFVILLGRHLEAASREKAASATSRMLELQPKAATRLRDGNEELVSVRALAIGDTVMVKAGERVPVDGGVLEGEGEVDESVLTGEAKPRKTCPGGKVIAGTMNVSGAMAVRMEKPLTDTALARMAHLMEEALSMKVPAQRMADRVVPYFVAATVCIAFLTFILWHGAGLEKALLVATSVLIITCPCALGLATPVAIAVAGGEAARHGVLIRNPQALEALAKVQHLVFDKTGALTEGKMEVSRVAPYNGFSGPFLLRTVGALERFSGHSIGSAVVRKARAAGEDPSLSAVEGFRAAGGRGIRGTVNGTEVMAGNAEFLEECGVRPPPTSEAGGVTMVHCSIGGEYAGTIEISDSVRPDSRETVEALRREGKRITMLTGDSAESAQAVALAVGGIRVMSGMTPEAKYEAVGRFRKEGEVVAMVGDGVNDAPALACADVGIAVGIGADVTVETADIVLPGNRLSRLMTALRLSRETARVIRQNLKISLAYNIIMVPLAVLGHVTPVLAAVAMPVSSLLVIGNSARIRGE